MKTFCNYAEREILLFMTIAAGNFKIHYHSSAN